MDLAKDFTPASMASTISERPYCGFQPQSVLAAESSIDCGQESAMACLKSGAY